MKKRIFSILCATLLCFGIFAGCADDAPPAKSEEELIAEANASVIYVEDGKFMRNGEEYYGYGLNYYSLFNVGLKEKYNSETGIAGLEVLAEKGIPYVRVNFGVFGYNEQRYYFEKKEEYFRLMDEIVAAAERLNVGIIASFFWNFPSVPDYYDEPLREWGNPDSQTREYVRTYTKEIVERYRYSPAIWMWEFGNEWSNYVDLPNAAENVPSSYPLPSHSTRTNRDARDYLKSEDLVSAMTEWAEIIHELDKTNRAITSGNSHLRPSAYNQKANGTWTKDTHDQQKEMAEYLNPSYVDTFCEHMYSSKQVMYVNVSAEEHPAGETYYDDTAETTWEDYIADRMLIAQEIQKPFILGEFGYTYPNSPFPDAELKVEKVKYLFDILVENKVQMAMYWNYDPKAFLSADPDTNANDKSNGVEWSFDENSFKKFVFDKIAECNEALNKE